MSLDNSQTTPSLPEDLKQHIENARNNLTLMEAELARLTKLSQQEKDTITSINAEKVDSQNQLDQVKKYLEEAINELALHKGSIQSVTNDLKVAREALTQTLEIKENSEKELRVKTGLLDEREKSVKNQEDSINLRNIELMKKESEHFLKVERLRKAIEE